MTHDPYDFNTDGYRRTSPDEEPTEEPLNLALSEETLEGRVVERRQGTVRIHTRVETDRVTAAVDLHHDDVAIDHIDVNEDADVRREPWYEGEALMIPVYEEVLVTQTQLVLKEVIRLRNKVRVERVNLEGEVRRDVVDISETNDD